jgi:hypothetical protein
VGDALTYTVKKVCIVLASLAAGVLPTAVGADEPELINSAVYAGVNGSFKACLEAASRVYYEAWFVARTKNSIGSLGNDVPLEIKPIDEASKMNILGRFKRGLTYCKEIRDFALEHAKADVGEPLDPVPLQKVIAKEIEELLAADVKQGTDALRNVLLGRNGATNFANMIGVLKELHRYRRQSMAEVFLPH